jgi:hypothetical protein
MLSGSFGRYDRSNTTISSTPPLVHSRPADIHIVIDIFHYKRDLDNSWTAG